MADREAVAVDALIGRANELERIASLLETARQGRGQQLVLVGPPGQGKTALLAAAARTATDEWLILRLRGHEAESELPWAGLSQLERALTEVRSSVRNPEALDAAFGVGGPATPVSRLAVLMAVLDALSVLAATQPVLLLVDDLHWLDPESRRAVTFLGQRLDGLRLAIVAARRDLLPALGDEVALPPLSHSDAELLLAEMEGVSTAVRTVIAARLDGNPLALRETVAALTPAQRAGTTPLPDPLPLGAGLEAAYQDRLAGLPQPTRLALLLLAASGPGEAGLLPESISDFESAEAEGLVDLGPHGPTFRHPLVRSAVYWAADPAERRAAHRTLAEVGEDPFTKAWHAGAATVGHDADVAADLAAAAGTAVGRGALHAAATAWQRAAELSPDPDAAAAWLVAAAGAALDAGDLTAARLVLDSAPGHTDGAALLRMRLAALEGTAAEAALRLAALAEELVLTDLEAAGQALLEGALRCLPSGLALEAKPLLDRAAELSPTSEPLTSMLDIARGVHLCLTGQYEAGLELVNRYERLLERPDPPLAPLAALVPPLLAYLNRPEATAVIERFFTMVASRPEAALALPYLHHARGMTVNFTDLASGVAAATHAVALADALDAPALVEGPLQLLVITLGMAGDPALEQPAERLSARASLGSMPDASARSSRNLLALLERRHDDAVAALLPLWEWEDGEWKSARIWHPDLAEAAVLADQPELAVAALARLQGLIEILGVGTMPWLEGSTARVEAMLADLDDCGPLFASSVETILAAGRPFSAARSALVWGERLRRARRRAEARVPLAQARELFDGIGAVRWAARAEQELEASGGAVRLDDVPRGGRVLSPKQLEVARWTVSGLTYREIAERLFVSPRTVETHLSTIYRKLDVRNRAELAARAAVDSSLVEP